MKAASIIGLVLLALFSLCVSPCLPHDLKLVRMKRQFRELPHPPSRVLAFEADLGLLEGNGNHCDYFVGELRASKLDAVAMAKAYDGKADVEAVNIPSDPWFPSPRDRLHLAAKGQMLAPDERLYVVSMFDQEAPGMDFRCH
ncbi:MAG: hypothetical protein QM817_28980 [Archangium sp.]